MESAFVIKAREKMNILFCLFPHLGHINPCMGIIKKLLPMVDKMYVIVSEEYASLLSSYEKCELLYYPINMLPFTVQSSVDLMDILGNEQATLKQLELSFQVYEKIYIRYKEIFESQQIHLIYYDTYAFWGNILSRRLGVSSISIDCFYVENENIARKTLYDYLEEYYGMDKDEILKLLEISHRQERKVLNKFNRRLSLNFQTMEQIKYSKYKNIALINRCLQPYSESVDINTRFAESYKDHTNMEIHNIWQEGLVELKEHNKVKESIDNSHQNYELMDEEQYYNHSDAVKLFVTFGRERGNRTIENINQLIKLFVNKPNYEIVVSSLEYKALRQRITWKNVKFFKTVLQVSILKQCDIMITHGGVTGVKEAILMEVPMIFFPSSIQQYSIAKQAEKINIGILYKSIPSSWEEFKQSLNFVTGKKIKSSIKEIKNIMLNAKTLTVEDIL